MPSLSPYRIVKYFWILKKSPGKQADMDFRSSHLRQRPILAWRGHHEYIHSYIILTPLNPTLIKQNWSLQGYTLSFLISVQKHRLWALVRTASARQFKRVPTNFVLSKNMKTISFFIWQFSFFGGKIFSIFEQARFRNVNRISRYLVLPTWNLYFDIKHGEKGPYALRKQRLVIFSRIV